MRRSVIATACIVLLAGCASSESLGEPSALEVDVTATLALSPASDRLTGTIVLDLALPDGEAERDLILTSVAIGGRALTTDEITGLEAFPDAMGGGDQVQVELGVDVVDLTNVGSLFSYSALCNASIELPVDVAVLDAEGAESGGYGVFTSTLVTLIAPPPPPAQIAIAKTWDLDTLYEVAADPLVDDDLLIAAGSRLARVGVDGTAQWETSFPGDGSIVGVARGGGVDAFAAFGDLDGLPCDPSPADDLPSALVARVEAGAIVWCAALPTSPQRLAVTDDGTIVAMSAASGDGSSVRLLMFPLEGEALDLVVAVPPSQMAIAGDAVVVGGTDVTGNGRLAIVRDGVVRRIDLHEGIVRLVERRDGTVGLVVNDMATYAISWRSLDTVTEEMRLLSDAPPELYDAPFVELPDGTLVTVVASGPLVATRFPRDGIPTSDVLTCSGQSARQVNGARGHAILALDADVVRLGADEITPPGALRTIVVELAELPP